MRSIRRKLLGTLLPLFLAVAGARHAAAQAPKPACTLLTPSEIGAQVGAPIGAGESTGTNGCQWIATKQVGSALPRATLVFYGADAWSGMTANFPRVTKRDVPGLGDAAVFATTGELTTLSVKKGSTVFVLRVYGVDGATKQMAVERALAGLVLGRM